MSKPLIRVALIGQGFMGRAHSNAYRQAPHFFDLPYDLDCRLLCGRNRDVLEKTAATWGWSEISTDWRAAVARSDIDLVDIAVPNALHAPIALAAAEAGKMVLCEKPLATSAEEAVRMAEAARGVPNFVWFNYRRVPAVALCRRFIDEGRIGRVFHYRATYLQEWGNDPTRPPGWKTQRAEAGSGVLGDLLSHLVDTALWLNGPIREVCSLLETFATGRDVDDAVMLLARFANGSIGTFEATRYAVGYTNCNAFTIHGEGGMLRFNLEEMNWLEYAEAAAPRERRGIVRVPVANPSFWKPGHPIGYEHTFIAALADFLFGLSRGEAAHPTFEDGRETAGVLDAAARAAAARAWVPVTI